MVQIDMLGMVSYHHHYHHQVYSRQRGPYHSIYNT